MRLPCVFLVLAGCAAAPLRPEPRTDRYVLIRAAATLYAAPDFAAEALNPYAQPTPPKALEAVSVFQLVEDRGAWLELETLAKPWGGEHCNGGISELEGLRLRLFVPARERVLATTREVQVGYDDGTRVTLAAGVPLWPVPGQRGLYHAHEDSLALQVFLPADAVGDAYQPSRKLGPAGAPQRMLTSAAVQRGLSYGRTGRAVETGFVHFAMEIDAVQPAPGGLLAHLSRQCLAMTVLAQPDDLVPYSVGGLLGMVRGGAPAAPLVRAGAKLWWRSGTLAGQAAEDTGLRSEIEPAGGRRCFEKPLRYIGKNEKAVSPLNFARLCVDEGDAVLPPVAAAR